MRVRSVRVYASPQNGGRLKVAAHATQTSASGVTTHELHTFGARKEDGLPAEGFAFEGVTPL